MRFDPDILVTGDSSELLLVVETKVHASDTTAVEPALQEYMWGSHCPVGLIVDPAHISIFRDSFRRDDQTAIEKVGRFAIPTIAFSGDEFAFESAVQSWLDGLREKRELGDWESASWDAVSDNVLPALRSGEVRAAHPRFHYA